MKTYEYTLILSPLLPEETVTAKTGEMVSFLQEQGGILENQEILGKQPLLSPIGKYRQGHVVVLQVLTNPEHQLTIEKTLKGREDVLRFLILAKKPPKQHAPKSRALKPRTERKTAEQPASSDEKAVLEDIDKKLNEIFKDES